MAKMTTKSKTTAAPQTASQTPKPELVVAQAPATFVIADTPVRDAFREIAAPFGRIWKKVRGTSTKQTRSYGIGIVGLLVLAFVAALIQIYLIGWSNPFTAFVANIIPLQAGSVDGQGISVIAFDRIDRPYSAMNKKAANAYSERQIAQTAFGMAASQSLVLAYAREHNITVTNDELKTQMNNFADANGGKKTLAKQVKSDFGLSWAGYQDQTYQRMLAAKVDIALKSDSQRVAIAQEEAQKVLKNLTKDTFESVELKQSGRAPVLTADQIPAAVGKVGAGLHDGTLAIAPILVDHVFYLLDRVGVGAKGVQYRVMTFPVAGLSTWLSEQQQANNNIVKYLPQTR